ncbi:unnamed protein product [Blepharisma stoltei]|uniref:Uncharacterized protein n=1 Tax=Blepharisma stoltei TaxID=1481888 RepID=A0AAU9JXW7_9CILI|nr:unnamed protein product [Blepharisma stoltei]
MGNSEHSYISGRESLYTDSTCVSPHPVFLDFSLEPQQFISGPIPKPQVISLLNSTKSYASLIISDLRDDFLQTTTEFLSKHRRNSIEELPIRLLREISKGFLENFQKRQQAIGESFQFILAHQRISDEILTNSIRNLQEDQDIKVILDNMNNFEPSSDRDISPEELLSIMRFKAQRMEILIEKFNFLNKNERLIVVSLAIDFAVNKKFGLSENEINYAILHCIIPSHGTLFEEFQKVNKKINSLCRL